MRPRIDRANIFKLLALKWNKKKIKKEGKISEATYWRIKAEFSKASDVEKRLIRDLAIRENKACLRAVAKAKFIDYPMIQRWVALMKSDRIKSWKKRFYRCRRVWKILQKKNPENWTVDDIKIRVIPKLRKRMKSVFLYLVAIRSLRPDFKDKLTTKREKPQPSFAWKYVYERIMQQNKLEQFFKAGGLKAELLKKIHVTLGCREGRLGVGGILGLEWNRINWKNKTIDVFEGKTGGGFYWLNCPLDLFGDKTFEMLKEYLVQQGKPTKGKIFGDLTYEDLRATYKQTAQAIDEEYGRDGITPHFARKLHASLLIDADVPLEMVAGDKPFGVMGVGWETLTTLKKYYVAFRKSRIMENRQKARQIIRQEVIM